MARPAGFGSYQEWRNVRLSGDCGFALALLRAHAAHRRRVDNRAVGPGAGKVALGAPQEVTDFEFAFVA